MKSVNYFKVHIGIENIIYSIFALDVLVRDNHVQHNRCASVVERAEDYILVLDELDVALDVREQLIDYANVVL